MWNLKRNDTNELTYKTEKDREWTYGCWGKRIVNGFWDRHVYITIFKMNN